VQLRSSWWWTQWCPKHVERNNVNKILRILKQSASSWRFYSSYYVEWCLCQICSTVYIRKDHLLCVSNSVDIYGHVIMWIIDKYRINKIQQFVALDRWIKKFFFFNFRYCELHGQCLPEVWVNGMWGTCCGAPLGVRLWILTLCW